MSPTGDSERLIRPEEVPAADAKNVLAFLNAVGSAEELAQAVEIAGERDVGTRVAQRILDRRNELGKFTDLRQVADVQQVGPERFAEIIISIGKRPTIGDVLETPPQEEAPFIKERLAAEKLLADNPNYFGTVADTELPVVQAIKFNTNYEELTCVGLWPERNLLEATIEVKLPYGFMGDLCSPGSYEYVRFYIDWNGDGDFVDVNEDAGVASVNVHDIPQVKEHHLCYAVRRRFRPLMATCKDPYIVKLRAILSWQQVPTGPSFTPIWGNVLECWIQVDPVEGKVVQVLTQQQVAAKEAAEKEPDTKSPQIEKERTQFLELVEENPNYFGTLPSSELKPVNPIEYDTRYEELKCIGLFPEDDFLEAILEVKRPYGFMGDLCSPGSYEYVRFYIDWNGDGDFVDFNEDAGVAAVNVHDIREVEKVHLCYALGERFRALRASCQNPYIVKVRAILSWQQVPTGPNFIPVWGNVVECWVQVNPTDSPLDHLVGEIDLPTADDCVDPIAVPACSSGGAPLAGIRITGSAGGGPFQNYILRYSWGGNPPINDAVVYPDCSRPPTSVSSSVPVINGTLGYLDVEMLPPGMTEFTIYLDVYGAGATHVPDTRTFRLRSSSVEITAAATVDALVAEDPFHGGSFIKLIKATNNPSIAVPEVSIGGSISVTGSAYLVGCDRIMSQYALVHFDAPPASPAPTFPDASGGTPLMAPVVYADSTDHPWQSGCIGNITSNIIQNGNLVAYWGSVSCTFLGVPYTRPKVKPVPSWGSGPLNGRYVVLLEARDRLVLGGTFPGAVAEVDQVVVWIDNEDPTASITSIGGLAACADLYLSNYVGTTAELRGVAWDPPIDPTAPQQAPNDNFDFYAMSFKKNGVAGSDPIPPATPSTRVPNVWPGPLGIGADGVLANWDIVGALDGGAGPLPPGSHKLPRDERCAYVITLGVHDNTHVGDSGNHHDAYALYAINIINDL